MQTFFPKLKAKKVAVETVPEISSTNDVLAGRIGQSSQIQLLAADRQTAGHGKFDREFYSPSDGAYFSLGWPLALLPEGWTPQRLTLTAAVAAREVCEEFSGRDLTVKWVNDLYIQDRKLAGILAETALDDKNQLAGVVVGIGINLAAPAKWPRELKQRAGALFAEPVSKQVRFQLIDDLCSRYLDLLSKPWPEIIAAYREKQYLAGREIVVDDGHKKTAGLFAGIDEEGRLVLQTENGKQSFAAGTVRLAR
jgi:BirA family biotin operon repressor/biotin-[acetyl-CoA-carboxylase] ligase